MSLHKFADMVASKGRGDDSLLIHMTPDEVRNLQKFAEANGKTLTINPDTGLPEAGMLSDLFKTIAPIALGAFLGPGAFGIAGMGLSAGTAGLVTGGLTTLATGSLSRGLMAGLGAYGGAGLAEGFANAGANAMTTAGVGDYTSSLAERGIFPTLEGGAVNPAFGEEASKIALEAKKQAFAAPVTDRLSAGFTAATADPSAMGAFAKNNLTNIGMAAAPIMAGAMVPTTTKMPENTNPAYIRQKLYDPFTQTYKSLTPIKASEFGSRNFSDAYTNPQTGIAATLDQRQPTPMAGGGIVALAGGGDVPGYANGMLVGDQDVFNYFKGLDQAKLASGALDAQIAADMQKYNVGAADIGRITGTQANQGDFEKRFVQAINPATLSSADFLAKTADVGLQDQALVNAMQGAGLSTAGQYASTHGLNDAAGISTAPKSAQDFYNTIGYTAGALPGDQGGLSGLYANINYSAKGLQDQINAGKLTVEQAQTLALGEMDRVGVNQKDIKNATGVDFATLFKPKTETKTPLTCPAGYRPNAAGTACELIPVITPPPTPQPPTSVVPTGFYGNNTGDPRTSTPGDITRNPDGTVTVTPNIPGRPDGGFTGTGQVRDTYTAGGGSLGYTAPVPKTAAEHDAMYNRLTDDSLDAYNFLMGKGKNLAQVNAAKSRPLMQPYFTGSNRYKPKFLSYDKDGQVVSSGTSGKTGDAKVADLTKAKTIEVVDSSGYDTQTYTAVLQDDGTYLAGNGKRYDVSGKELAAGGGMMGYAMGGGLGSLGSYSDGGRLLKGPGDGVSDSIPATIGAKQQPARLADGEFVIPARIVSELGNGSTDAGAKKLYAMMDRVQRARGKTTGKNKIAANSRADKHLPA
jgi:hypothetical protein